MLEQIIIGLLIVMIVLMLYFNLSKGDKQEDFNIQAIKDVQVEIKEKIIERDTLDLESIEKAKLSSETEAKILREELKDLNPDFIGMRGGVCRQHDRTSALVYAQITEVKALLLNCNIASG
jgi:uncharacterized protein (UPF0264 family)